VKVHLSVAVRRTRRRRAWGRPDPLRL